MAYIAPNSTVQYFSNVNLSPSYENSVYFATAQNKDSDFSNMGPLATESSVSYVYKDRNSFRSSLPISTLINARYMRFRNTSFENKWFYAFITSVDYINNNLTEVSFEIDDLMTWMGTFTLSPCLVVREHTSSDNPYEHLVEENLPTGDYTLSGYETINIDSDPQLVLSIARSSTGSTATGSTGHYKGNIVSGAEYRKYNISPTGATDLQTDIDALITANQKDAMISAQIVFGKMAPVTASAALEGLTPMANFTGNHPSTDFTFDGYTPKNKKLYNYPYCLMSLFNSEGSETEFRYEFFNNHVPHFYVFGIAADVPEMAAIPTQYKNSGIAYLSDQMLVMKQFPQASISVDQFRAYVAQMTTGGGWVSVLGNIAKTAIGGASAGMATGGPIGAAAGGIGGAAASFAGEALNIMQDSIEFSSLPNAVKGSANSNILMGINNKKFVIYHRRITGEYAKSIDDYFTAYGYRVNKVKTPSMYNRQRFTYVQTYNCNVVGPIPASAARTIENIFNKGCRFFVNIADVGNLSLQNNPLS